MNKEIVPHAGWNNNLRFSNSEAEVIVTLDVGPRIISYKTPSTANVFKTFDAQLGHSGESEWMIRGGHRLWIAPEDEVLSYHQDNSSIEYKDGETPDETVFVSLQDCGGARILKTLGVTLAPNSSSVAVRHTATNQGDEPIRIASWALSVMNPGGLEIIPQPALGEHPRDLLPNRKLVLWAYLDMTDPRWKFGKNFFTLRQSDKCPPTKLGLAHGQKWIAYVLPDAVFIKTFDHVADVHYPDGGCNFETFSNSEMLEIESLSPLATLASGESISHTEHWHLFPNPLGVPDLSDAELVDWIAPFLYKAGL